MLDCVLISKDETFRKQVTRLLADPDAQGRLSLDLPSSADQLPREAVGKILSVSPKLVFLDLGDTSTTGLRVLKALGQDAPGVAVIVTGPELPADQLLEVIRSGAAEYLPRPLDFDETEEAFRRVRRKLGPISEAPTSRGRVIAVFSAKGGTGVTTVAANLAVLVAERTGEPTLLLDLAPALGTAALSLGVQPRYSYLDVIQNFHRIDEELFESFVENHESGLSILASPTLVAGGQRPTAEQTLGLVRFCQRHFAHVIVDAGTSFSPEVTSVLKEADERLVVSTPELPTLRNLKRAMELVEGYLTNGSGPPHVVLNQYREGTGVSTREVEEALGRAVFVSLDWDDETVIRSLNLGQPVTALGRSRLARSLGKLSDRLSVPDRTERGRSALSFLPFRNTDSRK